MADYDRNRNQDHSRDRLGQRDVYLDDRTGIGDPPRGYRAEWGGGRDQDRAGDREQNYNMRRAENASFSDDDYGQQDGGRTGYRAYDSDDRYGGGRHSQMYGQSNYGGGDNERRGGEGRSYEGASGSYGQGGRWTSNRSYEDNQRSSDRYSQSGSRYAAGDQMSRSDADSRRGFASYPARSNPDFYADERGSAGPGWAENFGSDRDRSLASYQDRNQYERPMNHSRGGHRTPAQEDYASHTGGPNNRSYEADYTHTGDRDHRGRQEQRGFWDRAADKVSSWFGSDDDNRGMHAGFGDSTDRQSQTHRGRGPKGYRRSDERIREEVSDRLTDDHWLDASDIEVKVENCEVTLTGHVRSRDDKRRAEHLAEQISGVDHVQNNLRVHKEQSSSYGQSGRTNAGQDAISGSFGGFGSGEAGNGLSGQAAESDMTGDTGATGNASSASGSTVTGSSSAGGAAKVGTAGGSMLSDNATTGGVTSTAGVKGSTNKTT